MSAKRGYPPCFKYFVPSQTQPTGPPNTAMTYRNPEHSHLKPVEGPRFKKQRIDRQPREDFEMSYNENSGKWTGTELGEFYRFPREKVRTYEERIESPPYTPSQQGQAGRREYEEDGDDRFDGDYLFRDADGFPDGKTRVYIDPRNRWSRERSPSPSPSAEKDPMPKTPSPSPEEHLHQSQNAMADQDRVTLRDLESGMAILDGYLTEPVEGIDTMATA